MRNALSSSVRAVFWAAAIAGALSLTANASDDIQWKPIGPGGLGNMFTAGISPADPNIVVMGGDVGGIVRTGDGGQTWALSNGAYIDPARFSGYGMFPGHAEFDPVTPSNVYIGATKSKDAGVTFKIYIDESQLTAGMSLVDPSNHNVVYAFTYANIYRSSDGWESTSCITASGASCSPLAPLTTCNAKSRCYQNSCLPTPGSGQTSAPGCISYNDLIWDVVLDPTATGHLLACATSGLYQSLDGATTWTQIMPASLPYQNCKSLALNYKASTQTKTLYMLQSTHPLVGVIPEGTWTDIDTWQGGVYKSTNWGGSWTSVNGIDESNLLPNAGFETAGGDGNHPAANWSSFGAPAVTPDNTRNHTPGGTRSIKVSYVNPQPGGSVVTDPSVSIQGGELYKISGWFKTDSATGIPVDGAAFFYDAQQNPLKFPGVTWNFVEPFFYSVDTTQTTFDWRRFEGFFRAPDAARSMQIYFSANYGGGTTWIDDVSLVKSHSLAKISGSGSRPYFVDYYDLAVDPTDANIVYVGTNRGTWSDSGYADQGGVWKTSDGGATWSLTTRHQWHDNFPDPTVPECGDNVCNGKWENCNTCPVDCTGTGKPATPPGCCGDAVCYVGPNPNSPVETYDNCPADCPFDADPGHPAGYEVEKFYDTSNGATYYSARANGNTSLGIWTIAVGSGAAGHNTVYAGSEHLKSTNGGTSWTEMSTVPYTGGDSQPGTAQARGATNDVYTFAVVTDTRVDPVTGSAMNRLYYGDTDSLLQVSYNGGKSFAQEGWQWPPWNTSPHAFSAGLVGDAATSIVLDPVDPNKIYVGMNVQASDYQGIYDPTSTCCGGTLQGVFNTATAPAVRRWTWTPLGNQSTFPKGYGGTELIRTTSGTFFASIFARGVYKLNASNDWVNTDTGNNWTPAPAGWLTYRLVQEPTSGRMFVGAGHAGNRIPAAGETGVWESTDNGATWHRISDPNSGSGSGMDMEPIQDIAVNGPNTLFVATWYAHQVGCSVNCTTWDGDGGLYKGTRNVQTGAWTWTKVISQPLVTGVTVSPANSSIIYAFVGQDFDGGTPHQQAGIYKSTQGGALGTWTLLDNNGLQRIDDGKLYFSSSDSHRIYASTIGDGVFEGTISCGPVSEGFTDSDGDGIPNCAFNNITQQVTMTTGSIVSGGPAQLICDSSDNAYEVLQEQTSGNARQMIKVWKFDNVPTGKQFELWVEGFRTSGGGSNPDAFDFDLITKTAGSACNNNDTYPAPQVLTVTNTSDGGQAQKVNVGVIPNPVVCVRAKDSVTTGDTKTDKLTLDRVCLHPLP